MLRRWGWSAALLCGLLSCREPTGGTALRVSIDIEPGLASKCVRVEVVDAASGAVLETSAGASIDMRQQLLAGIFRNALPETVALRAIGFTDATCATRASPDEQSELVEASFPSPPTLVRDVSLVVKRSQMMSVDADRDGSPAGTDCDDADPRRRPGLAEDCTDGKDNDCNQLADCGDGVCTGRQCKGAGSQCLPSGVCSETLCEDAFDNDQDGPVDCADSDCNARPCSNGGTCTAGSCANAESERSLCTDGVDNDNDGRVDCQDNDCNQSPCDDGLGCTRGEVCNGPTCFGGIAVVCPASTNACEASTGTCQEPDGGCVYSNQPQSQPCDDGSRCTHTDRCDGDGGCLGSPVICSTPPAGSCWAPSGRCEESDGGCTYEIAVGELACTDGDLCTVNDTCLEDGGCLGAALDCSTAIPPSECVAPTGTCTSGACDFAPRAGACSVGSCVAGVCVAADAGSAPDAGSTDGGAADAGADAGVDAGASPPDASTLDAGTPVVDAGPPTLTPSNVTLPVIRQAPAFAHLDIACNTTVNLNPFSVSSQGCATPTFPPVIAVAQANAPEIQLFVVDALTVRSGAQLRIVRGSMGQPSDRVPMFAVRGNATIDGVINVSAVESLTDEQSGPGGNGPFCPTSTAGEGQASRSGGGQGGGFGLSGGNGGRGADSGGDGAPGRAQSGNETLTPLRGGCGGSTGGNATAGQFGRAGGALQLWVRDQLVLNGSLVASGGRGLPAFWTGGGGGGGGSGGGLLIEAGRITIGGSAIIAANGGSGAEGSGDGVTGIGRQGNAGTVGVTNASGGTGGTDCGGRGGRGGSVQGGATNGQEGGVDSACNRSNFGGGGGGGGAVGRVRINTSSPCVIASQARLSPRPSSGEPTCAP